MNKTESTKCIKIPVNLPFLGMTSKISKTVQVYLLHVHKHSKPHMRAHTHTQSPLVCEQL